jgi:hypothetical protein
MGHIEDYVRQKHADEDEQQAIERPAGRWNRAVTAHTANIGIEGSHRMKQRPALSAFTPLRHVTSRESAP